MLGVDITRGRPREGLVGGLGYPLGFQHYEKSMCRTTAIHGIFNLDRQGTIGRGIVD